MNRELYTWIYALICIFWCCISINVAQGQATGDNDSPSKIKYFEVTGSIGKVFGNFTNFPSRGLRKSLFLHTGKIRLESDLKWPSFYNYPLTGWTLGMAELGNREELGYQYSIMPYVEFRDRRLAKAKWSLYLGLGGSYFNRPFDLISNSNNKSIGGHFTWDLKIFINRVILRSDRFQLKLGAGLLHASSGHVELPNFGLNSFGINISGLFLHQAIPDRPFNVPNTKHAGGHNVILSLSAGIGLQELGGSDYPIDGPKKTVYTSSLGAALALNPHIRIKTGLRYRYYQAFHDYLLEHPNEALSAHPNKNSSSYHIYLGGEIILGYVSIDGDIGFTLYRPFYDRYFELFKKENGYDHFVGEYLPTRMGLNLYAIKPEKMPKHNISAGVHINANFSTADYSEISLKYYLKL